MFCFPANPTPRVPVMAVRHDHFHPRIRRIRCWGILFISSPKPLEYPAADLISVFDLGDDDDIISVPGMSAPSFTNTTSRVKWVVV